MRPLEISLLLVNLPILLSGLIARKRPPTLLLALPLVGIAIFACHYFIEGWRWQMAPAYLVTLFLFFLSVVFFVRPSQPNSSLRPFAMLGSLLGLATLGFANLLSVVLPVFRFPEPTGPHRIGTVSVRL